MTSANCEFEALLSEARKFPGAALGALFDRYRNLLKMLVRAQLRGPIQTRIDASDLVQDTLVQAVQGFGRFQGQSEAELVAWLRAILAYQLASLYRHHHAAKRSLDLERRLDHELHQSSVAMQASLGYGTSPSRVVEGEEQLLALAEAIESLPEHYRAVIVMRHVRGATFEDIASELNRSRTSVQKLWVRALAKLKQSMQEDW